MDMTKVFKLESYLGGTISAAEAKAEGIKTNKLPLASIEDCKKQVCPENLEYGYGGKIKVIEGIFEFNFDTCEYDIVGQ